MAGTHSNDEAARGRVPALSNAITSFPGQLIAVLLYFAVAALIPGSATDKVWAFVALVRGVLIGCGVSYFVFNSLVLRELEAHRKQVIDDVESLASAVSRN